MDRAISNLTALPTTKEGITNYVSLVKEDILSGYIPALESKRMLKVFEEIINQLNDDKDIKEYIQDAADLYVEKSFIFVGCKFSKSERPYYDFKQCEDPEWLDLSMKEMKIKAAKKTREEWLKKLTIETADPETGEVIKPPKVSKTSIVSIQLADR
jgi:hypothetical protein